MVHEVSNDSEDWDKWGQMWSCNRDAARALQAESTAGPYSRGIRRSDFNVFRYLLRISRGIVQKLRARCLGGPCHAFPSAQIIQAY